MKITPYVFYCSRFIRDLQAQRAGGFRQWHDFCIMSPSRGVEALHMVKNDRWIRRMAREHEMIKPFVNKHTGKGVISYGLSSYGYDLRIADEFKIFTSVNPDLFKTGQPVIVDPKNFNQHSFVDYQGDVCVIPPGSFALGRSVEYFKIPRNILALCLGKCLTGDTRVVDAETGDYLPLSRFVASRAQGTVALGDAWQLQAKEVSAHTDNGLQPIYQLTTQAGLKIKATAAHPFRTLQGWVPLAELRVGQRLAVARRCPIFGKTEWPEHEATLLGLMLADGQCHTPGHSPAFTTDDPRLAEALIEAARAFGCDVSHTQPLRYLLVNRRGRGGIMTKNRVYAWLEQLGCQVRSEEKFVPSVVFRAKREGVAAFLRALFSGDGAIYSSGAGFFLEYSTISERLAYDVRHLLLRFGIFALVRSKPTWNGKRVYRLQITDRNTIRHFATEIGFIPGSRKQKALQELLPRLKSSCKSNFDTLPCEAWERMREVVHASGQSAVGIYGTRPSQSLPYSLARQAAQQVGDPQFPALVEADVVWDTIVSIEPAGAERVYDLTVPGAHNFLANDLIAHNSTYARCGIIVNITPAEPEWEGQLVIEISNTSPLPAKIYANEGIAQMIFLAADEVCEISYADRKGKYQKQVGIVTSKVQ